MPAPVKAAAVLAAWAYLALLRVAPVVAPAGTVVRTTNQPFVCRARPSSSAARRQALLSA